MQFVIHSRVRIKMSLATIHIILRTSLSSITSCFRRGFSKIFLVIHKDFIDLFDFEIINHPPFTVWSSIF